MGGAAEPAPSTVDLTGRTFTILVLSVRAVDGRSTRDYTFTVDTLGAPLPPAQPGPSPPPSPPPPPPSPPSPPPTPPPPPPSPPLFTHAAVAATYAGCPVRYEGTARAVEEETAVVTATDGAFSLSRSVSGDEATSALVLMSPAAGCVDTATRLSPAVPLATPATCSVLTPLTTLVVAVQRRSGGTTTAAISTVNNALGVPDGESQTERHPCPPAKFKVGVRVWLLPGEGRAHSRTRGTRDKWAALHRCGRVHLRPHGDGVRAGGHGAPCAVAADPSHGCVTESVCVRWTELSLPTFYLRGVWLCIPPSHQRSHR